MSNSVCGGKKGQKTGNCHQSRGHDSINKNLVSGTGKLRFCSDVWKKFTCDPWILQTIAGYKIDFDSYPVQEHIPKEIIFSDSERDNCQSRDTTPVIQRSYNSV